MPRCRLMPSLPVGRGSHTDLPTRSALRCRR